MLAWLVLIVLLVGVLWAYFKGVRGENKKPWGKPLVAACALCVVIIVLGKAACGPAAIRENAAALQGMNDLERSFQARLAQMAGKGLKGNVPTPARIFFLGPMPTNMTGDWDVMWPAWEDGLSKGLGSKNWQSVGYAGPASSMTAEELSRVLKDHLKEIDVLISFDGLPADLQNASIYALKPPPKVAVCFPQGADLDAVRGWLSGGFIQAAVVHEKGESTLYTRDKMP